MKRSAEFAGPQVKHDPERAKAAKQFSLAAFLYPTTLLDVGV
jgi:hypothetical protein